MESQLVELGAEQMWSSEQILWNNRGVQGTTVLTTVISVFKP